MTIEINGMADVILTVSRFEVAREFYRKLLPEFGMKPVFETARMYTGPVRDHARERVFGVTTLELG